MSETEGNDSPTPVDVRPASAGVNPASTEVQVKIQFAQKLDCVALGLFFIWVAIAMVADLGWGVGLLGVAIIILAKQVLRLFRGIKIEGFWLVIGILFVVGGIATKMDKELPLVPILLAIAGGSLLSQALLTKARKDK